MRFPIAHLLIGSLLLISLSACHREEPVPDVPNTASYVLDGTARNCTAICDTSSRVGYTYLTISLATTPRPSRGPETLVLNFYKPASQPATAYKSTPVGGLVYYGDASGQGEGFNSWGNNLFFTASGGASGTFDGRLLDYTGANSFTVRHTLTSGVFTDVHR